MRAWLLEIEALDPADQPVTLRYSDVYYKAPHAYLVQLKQPALLTVRAAGAVVGSDKTTVGSATLINKDGSLNELADYAVDGRSAVLKLATDAGVSTVLTGTVRSLSFDGDLITIKLRDPAEALATPHPYAVYGGTNALPAGVDGTAADIKGAPKPRVCGSVSNATPVCVNTAQLIYQLHDGSNVSIAAARDRAVALTDDGEAASLSALLSTSVAGGHYKRYIGYIKLGAIPGALTCDGLAAVTGAGSVVAQLLADRGWTLHAGDAAALDAVGSVGLYLAQPANTDELLNTISRSLGAYWAVIDNATVTMKLLTAPAATSPVIRDAQVKDLRRRQIGAGQNGLPIWRVVINADPVETVQTDVSASAPAATAARLAAKYRAAVAEDATVKTRHPLAGELSIDSCLRSVTAAQSVADRLLALLKVRRDLIEIDAYLDDDIAASLQIGTELRLVGPKWGYGAGRSVVVLGYLIDARVGLSTLYLWG